MLLWTKRGACKVAFVGRDAFSQNLPSEAVAGSACSQGVAAWMS